MCVYFSSPALAEIVLGVAGFSDSAKCSSAFYLKGICNWKGHQHVRMQILSASPWLYGVLITSAKHEMPTPPALEVLMWLSMVKGLANICPAVPKERACCFCCGVVCFLTSSVCRDAVLDGLETPSLSVGILAAVGRRRVSSPPHA